MRGLNDPSISLEVRKLLLDKKVGPFALPETKIRASNFNCIKGRVGDTWLWENNLNSDDYGRILIGWNTNKYEVWKGKENRQVVHITVRRIHSNMLIRVTFVYANNSFKERRGLLRDLVELSLGSDKPWVVLGDMNNVFCSFERIGGDSVQARETDCLVECCKKADPIDFNSKGTFFTCLVVVWDIEGFGPRLIGVL